MPPYKIKREELDAAPIQNLDSPYADLSAMYADQANQEKGYAQRVTGDTKLYYYLGTTNANGDDYLPFGGGGNLEVHEESSYTWNTGDNYTFIVTDSSKVTDVYLNGKRLEKFEEDGVTPDEWRINSATEIEIILEELSDGDKITIVKSATGSGGGISSIDGGAFTGEFDVSGNNVFHEDYISGNKLTQFTLSATKVLGATDTVRIKGDLMPDDIPASWNFSGQNLFSGAEKLNELSLMYVRPTDIRLINRVVNNENYVEPLQAEYQAFLDYGTANGFELPNATQQEEDNLKVKYLKDIGEWDNKDIIYIDNATNYNPTSFAVNIYRLNWKNPASYERTSPVSKEPDFIQGSGFKVLGGSDKHFTTGYTPSLNAVNLQVSNSAVIFNVFDLPSTWSASIFFFGGRVGNDNGQLLFFNNALNGISARLFQSGGTDTDFAIDQTLINGHYHISEIGATSKKYKDGVLISTDANDETGVLGAEELHLFGANNGGVRLDAGGSVGLKYTLFGQASEANQVAIYEILTNNFTP